MVLDDKGYHEADFLYDFLVLLFFVGQQPLKQKQTHSHHWFVATLW